MIASAASPQRAAAQVGAQPTAMELLDGVVAEALAANPGLAQERWLEARAAADVREARGRYLPSLAFEGRYSEQDGTLNLGDVVNPSNAALNQLLGEPRLPTDLDLTLPFRHESRLRLVQTVFDERVRAGHAAARHAHEGQREQRRVAARRLAADAQTAFLQVAAARSARRVWESTLPLVVEGERVAERRVDAGTATPDAVFRARAERSDVEQRLLEAREQEAAAARAFNRLMARPLDADVEDLPESLVCLDDALTEEAEIEPRDRGHPPPGLPPLGGGGRPTGQPDTGASENPEEAAAASATEAAGGVLHPLTLALSPAGREGTRNAADTAERVDRHTPGLQCFAPALTVEAAVASALERREELAQVRAGVSAARSGVRLATASYLPAVAVALDYGFQGSTVRYDSDDDFGVASLVVSWNPFNGGQHAARRQAAQSDVERLRARLAETEDLVRLDVRQAHEAAAVAYRAIATAEAQLAAARRSFRLVQRRWEEGLASPIEFLDARTALTNAELNRSVTLYRYAIRHVDLERAAALRDLEPNE